MHNKGKHIIIDAMDVPREICLNDKYVLECMANAAERSGATVISQVRYKFGYDSPPGFTSAVLLDESHISCHTYADSGLLAMDIFTCGSTNPRDIFDILKEDLRLTNYNIKTVERFCTGENE